MHNDTSIERNSDHFLFNVFTFCILCHGICVIQVAAYNYIFVSRLIVWRERKRFILHRNLFGPSFTKYCIWFLITIPDIQIIRSDITWFDKYLSGTQTRVHTKNRVELGGRVIVEIPYKKYYTIKVTKFSKGFKLTAIKLTISPGVLVTCLHENYFRHTSCALSENWQGEWRGTLVFHQTTRGVRAQNEVSFLYSSQCRLTGVCMFVIRNAS